MHEKRNIKGKKAGETPQGPVPAYLLDGAGGSQAKGLSNTIKQKPREKAGKWEVSGGGGGKQKYLKLFDVEKA